MGLRSNIDASRRVSYDGIPSPRVVRARELRCDPVVGRERVSPAKNGAEARADEA